MYSWVGWRCHNPLAAKGERDRSLGQRGEEYMRQLLCSTHAGEWAWTCNVTAVSIVFRGSLLLWRKRGNWIHAPPLPDLASRWKKKMAKLQRLIPCHREIDLRRPPWWNLTSAATSLWLEDTRSCMFHTAGNTDIVEWWNMCEQTSKDAILAMMQLCNREKSPNWKSKVQMQFLSTTGCGMIDSCSLRIGQRILDAERKYGRRSSANDAAMTRWQPQHPCGNITLKSVIHFPRCYNKQYTVATQCFILKEEHLDTRSKGYVAMHREKIIPAYRRGPELRGFVAVTEVSDKSHGWIGEQKQLPQEVVTRTLESHKRQLAAAMSHEVIELEFAGGGGRLTIYHNHHHHSHVINSLEQQTSLFMPFYTF